MRCKLPATRESTTEIRDKTGLHRESLRKLSCDAVAPESFLLDRCSCIPRFRRFYIVPLAVEPSIPRWNRDGGCRLRVMDAGAGSAREIFQRPSRGPCSGNDGTLLENSASHLSLWWNSLYRPVYRLGQTDPAPLLFSDLLNAVPPVKKRGGGLATSFWRRIPPVQGQDVVLSRCFLNRDVRPHDSTKVEAGVLFPGGLC